MLSIHPVGDGTYYMHLTEREHEPGRYYLQEKSARVVWSGQGAHAIGLRAEVKAESFQRALRGLHPDTGAPLVRNAGKSDRRQAYDLTFSAPKAVSALWAVSDVSARREIEQAFDSAVQAAFRHLEETCGRTRRGKGGREIERAGLVSALFPHAASRANEPQLHTHCVLVNLGVRQDGTVGTLYTPPIYSMKMTLGALFRAELAAQLQRRLGLAVRPEPVGFGIEGVPTALCKAFSTRRKEIETALGASRASARASEVAALVTRRSKEEKPAASLFPVWQAVGDEYGFGNREVERLLTRRRRWQRMHPWHLRKPGMNRLLQDALSQLTQRQSCFTERELTRALAEQAPGRGAGAQQVIETVRRHLSENPNLVALGTIRGEMRYTTRTVLQEERRMLDRFTRMRRERGRAVSERDLSRAQKDFSHLSEEQRQALRHLTGRPGRVQILTGLAGTGKTDVLRACRHLWEKEGLAVYGVAVSGKAARGLQEASGIQSATAASFLRSLAPGELSRKTFHGRQFSSLNAMLKYAEKVRRPMLRLNLKSVVVVEEAGMMDTRTLARIVDYVYRSGAKLALVGDERQLQPIGAGGPLNSLQTRFGSARLLSIQRQREAWAREVVSAMSEGRAGDALRALWERGRIHIAADRRQAMDALLADWGQRLAQELPRTLILTGRRQEADYFNRQAQALRRKRGELGSAGLAVGDHTFYAGDRVLFTRNSRLYDVQNGALGTVVAVSPRLDLRIRPLRPAMRVLLDDGREVTINTGHYPHMTPGYAITTHKGQGVTVENAYILVGGGMQDLHLSYVQASRARGETRLYVDRLEAGEGLQDLMRAMSRDRRKILAADVQDGLHSRSLHARAEAAAPSYIRARPPQPRSPSGEKEGAMIRFCLFLAFVFTISALEGWAVWALLMGDGYVSEAAAGVAAAAACVYTFFFAALHLPLDPTPHELLDFLWRFALMHLVVIVLLWGVLWSLTILAPGMPGPVWLLVGGVALFLGFTGSYRILFDTSPARSWSRGMRLVMFRVAKRRADAARKPDDPGLMWGGVRLPSETATSHFLCLGTTRSGKTICLRLLMQDALRAIRPGSDHRALIYDAKQDILPMLAGMGLHCEVVTMAPFDIRGAAWDMAADVTSPAIAYQVASILIPEEKNASQPFFSDAARDLLAGVMIALMQVAPGRWRFRHVLLILKSPSRLKRVLEATDETRDLCIYLEEPRTMMDILATLSTKMAPFRAIAAAWSRAERAISLRAWLEGEFILVLGNDEVSRASVDAVNRVLFQRATELILSQEDSNTRRTWIFLDEVREAGRLKLNTLMTKAGSRGGAVVLAGQDIEGLRDVYGDAQTKEILSQASHKAILRLESPEAAKWASELVGHYEAVEIRVSDGWTSGPQGTNRSVSLAEQFVKREAVLPSEFMAIPLTNQTNGLTGYFLSPVTGVFRSTLSPAFLARSLRSPDPDVPGILHRSESEQFLGGWREDDWGRLSLLPPPPPDADGGADAAKPQTAPEGDTHAPQQGAGDDHDDPDTRHRRSIDRGL